MPLFPFLFLPPCPFISRHLCGRAYIFLNPAGQRERDRAGEEPRSLRWLNPCSSRPFALVVISISCDRRGGRDARSPEGSRCQVTKAGDVIMKESSREVDFSREAKAVWVNVLVTSDLASAACCLVTDSTHPPPFTTSSPQLSLFIPFKRYTRLALNYLTGLQEERTVSLASPTVKPFIHITRAGSHTYAQQFIQTVGQPWMCSG